ncbi:MAG: MOSC domain-containing protein [Methylophilaceae bacterium]
MFSKASVSAIELVAGYGVRGDAHFGSTVKHRSRVAKDPSQPNLRQVHLVHEELFAELGFQGFALQPGAIGENITTRGLELLALPTGTELHIGPEAIIKITGLRNPCALLDHYQPGLMKAVLARSPEGKLIRKTGVMSVVIKGGVVMPGHEIHVVLPAQPHGELECV